MAKPNKQKTRDELAHWERNAPQTARFKFDRNIAKNTFEMAKSVETANDLYIYIENYPREPAVLGIIYEPESMKYYFPLLKLTEEEIELAKKLVKNQIYSLILSRCKDSSMLDRLDANINPHVTITFKVLPKLSNEPQS